MAANAPSPRAQLERLPSCPAARRVPSDPRALLPHPGSRRHTGKMAAALPAEWIKNWEKAGKNELWVRGRGPGRAGGRKEGGLGLSAAAGGRCGLPGAGGPSRRPPGPGSAARCRASPKLAPAGRAWPARCPSALFLCWAGLAGASSLPPPFTWEPCHRHGLSGPGLGPRSVLLPVGRWPALRSAARSRWGQLAGPSYPAR